MQNILEQLEFVYETDGIRNRIKFQNLDVLGCTIRIPDIEKTKELTVSYKGNCEKTRSIISKEEIRAYLNGIRHDGIIRLKTNDDCAEKGKEDYIPPSVKYEDITEKEILGIRPLRQTVLEGTGIWCNNGLRLLKLTVSGVPRHYDAAEASGKLYFYTCDGVSFADNVPAYDELAETVREVYKNRFVKMPNGDIECFMYLDSDRLGQMLAAIPAPENTNDRKVILGGYLAIEFPKLPDLDGKHKVSYYLAIKIAVHDTNKKEFCEKIISPYTVSIDFGTTSTCVATSDDRGRIYLMSLSGKSDKGYNQYENPTNLMFYRWEQLYKKLALNDCPPILVKKSPNTATTITVFLENNPDLDLDFGHGVKSQLGSTDLSTKKISAVLTRLKMIPYYINQKYPFKFYSYDDNKDMSVRAVNNFPGQDEKNFAAQDEQTLDPVALYGYLLGRTINNPKENKLYTKFVISYPVKFNAEIVESIRRSLECGIKASVPKTLRGEVEVKMPPKNLEPLAYISALIGKKPLTINPGDQKLFAVFDFGGGTLDFLFGIISRSSDARAPEIKVLAQGGEENFGGESLIEQISFQIYCENYDNEDGLGDNRIPIRLPDNMPYKNFDGLTTDTPEAQINLKKINEMISRNFFEGKLSQEHDSFEIEFLDENKVGTSITLQVNEASLQTELTKKLKEKVESFISDMDKAFKDVENYDRNKVIVFRAGNSCKNKILQSLMRGKDAFQQHFENVAEMIPLIDETGKEDPLYAITPKTAVAIGQIKMSGKNFVISLPSVIARWNVGLRDPGNESKFEIKIERSADARYWQEMDVINNEDFQFTYSETTSVANAKDMPIHGLTKSDKGKILYMRACTETTVEYCVLPEGQEPDNEAETDHNKVLILK